MKGAFMAKILKLNELQTSRDRFLFVAEKLDAVAGDFSKRIDAVRGDPSLTDVGKGQKVGPILRSLDEATGPLMAELRQIHSVVAEQKKPWSDPLMVIRVHEAPNLGPDPTNTVATVSTSRIAVLAEAQASTPFQRQGMLDFAIAFGMFWEIPLILAGVINPAGASTLEGFDGIPFDELMPLYPTWRAGLVLIQEVGAHFMRVEMVFQNIEKGRINPLKKLAVGRAIATVQTLRDGSKKTNPDREASWQARHDRGEPARLQARIEKAIN
jgi:hypothetical protein